jgi:hypothetical protein
VGVGAVPSLVQKVHQFLHLKTSWSLSMASHELQFFNGFSIDPISLVVAENMRVDNGTGFIT